MPPFRTVVLGVAASDSHAVANQLVALLLRRSGYDVVNLGTCTTVEEFCAALAEHPRALALVIGTLNGHAREDLAGVSEAKAAGRIPCPVIVGGNLSVGSAKSGEERRRLLELGVDHVLEDILQLPPLL